jgi:hypothetical protein
MRRDNAIDKLNKNYNKKNPDEKFVKDRWYYIFIKKRNSDDPLADTDPYLVGSEKVDDSTEPTKYRCDAVYDEGCKFKSDKWGMYEPTLDHHTEAWWRRGNPLGFGSVSNRGGKKRTRRQRQRTQKRLKRQRTQKRQRRQRR